MNDNKFLYGSICLTDIPKELIRKSEKNGKQYLNIGISQLKEKGKYGDTHAVIVNVPKEQRQPNDRTIYIGNLKTWDGTSSSQQGTTQEEDDLPF
ncbi:hypothetical protein [Dysgonomonas sp. 25]|uniref:hypothetical protein n=1 Tax=Dysgonomonas sp. 25 TaxID=2302933 RepID=UPI0013D7A877|nr:hypothetical protein [Dysgonomonas sp. 25]NDV68562.1 hypothetical protein [Dysgonomonas sp. 25]